MDKHDDPYEILGVEHDADESTIKKAYFKLARQYHPDRQETEEEKQTVNSKFAKISDAYDLLNDTVRLYDWKKDYGERQSRPSVHSRQRRRSNSPHHYQARRYSARRSPGSLSPKRRQSPGPPSMPQSKASSPRTPPPGSRPRTIRTVKRSISPVPPQNGSSPGRHSPGRLSPGQYQSRTRKGLSPSAHRARRTTSPLPPRQSPGAYRQSPGTLRRKVQSTNPPTQRPNIRRPSSSGLSPPPPPVSRASFGSSPQLNPPQRSRSSWSSSDFNKNQMKSEEENPFDILELHWRADKVEVISAYRELAQQLHSSKSHASEKERLEAAQRLIQVTWAYDTLRDPKQLQEWQQKCKASGNDSSNKFHNSMSNIKGGWFPFRSRGKDDDDDDSSLIGNEEGDAKSMRSSSRVNSRRGDSSSPKRKGKPKISLLSNLGLPGQKESSKQEADNDGQDKKAARFPKFGFLGRKDASAVAAEDEAPQESPTSDILEAKPVKKKKKKKKKKKVPTNGDEAVDDEDDQQTRKTKKKRKKKKRPETSKPADYTWKREESKRVMEDSVRTANETTEEGSDDSLEHEHSILLTG